MTQSSESLKDLKKIYSNPLPSTRSGALFSAFPYPTKISPESISVYIASHTKPGDLVLDTFGGSGTTGIATHLCSNPNEEAIELAKKNGAPVIWGPRHAVIYELGVLGSFIAETMCNPPDPNEFSKAAEELINRCEQKIGHLYTAIDNRGQSGSIRYAIWSNILECSKCKNNISFWDAAVKFDPVSIDSSFVCPSCGKTVGTEEAERIFEGYFDSFTNQKAIRRKLVIKKIYGVTGKRKWSRLAIDQDYSHLEKINQMDLPRSIPVRKIPWGDLHRAGYHKGITHAHHFYSQRNLIVMGTLWHEIERMPQHIRSSLKFLILSYNSTHSTNMARVVVKKGKKDFVLTGAQSGVLYISNLPVEKNIFHGLRRKAKSIRNAFAQIRDSSSTVEVLNKSSMDLHLNDNSVDYVFTDPPFGDFIPYAELNFLNEVWLGIETNPEEEVIISNSQKKTISDYGKMMGKVFSEINRTLKASGKMTLVFHSSKAKVWEELQNAYIESGFQLLLSGILDKKQTSFKQTASQSSVKGDPLLLLSKNSDLTVERGTQPSIDDVILMLIQNSRSSEDINEYTIERLYSRFVNWYLQHLLNVPLDASAFYKKVKPLLEENDENERK